MQRIVLYPAIALVAATTAGAQNTREWRQQPLNPEVFAKPFPASSQQFFTTGGLGPISTVEPEGWRKHEWDYRFATPVPATAQQFSAQVAEHVPAPVDAEGFLGQQLEVRFAKPFPAAEQQYSAFQPRGVINSITPQGFQGQQLEVRFAKPFPVGEQQYTPITINPAATPQLPAGWHPQPPHVFIKPVSVSEQPFTTAPEPEQFLPGFGWYGYQFDYAFAKPFPVTEQVFSVWALVGEVPPNLPPGSGRRKDFPSYIPQPAYEAKPNKPFRPVWDKPKQGKVEERKPAAPSGPVPLPPAEMFGEPGHAGDAALNAPPPLGLPTFDQFVPHDLAGLDAQMTNAQDMSDAIAVLKKLGLIPEN